MTEPAPEVSSSRKQRLKGYVTNHKKLVGAAAAVVTVIVGWGGTTVVACACSLPFFPPPPANGGNNPNNPGIYNIFVSPTGSDSDTTNCVWNSSPVNAPPGGPGDGCLTFQKAYNLAVTNGAATTGANIGVYGDTNKYPIDAFDICTPSSGFSSQCTTMNTATHDITFWKDDASTLDPEIVYARDNAGSMTINGYHVKIYGPMGADLSGCTATHSDNVSGNAGAESAGACPALSIATYRSGVDKPIAHDILVDNLTFSRFGIGSAHDVTIQNSNFGPSYDNHGLVHCDSLDNPCDSTTRPQSITLLNDSVHDQYNSTTCKNTTGCVGNNHMGCGPTLNDPINVTINRSRFYNCEDTDMLIKPFVFSPDNITIKNSFFGNSGNGIDLNTNNCSPTCTQNLHIYSSTFADTNGYLSLNSNSDVGGCVGCKLRGNIIRLKGGDWTTMNGNWTVTNNYSTDTVTCGGGATCSGNVHVTSYGLDTDFIHLLGGSALLHVLPTGLSWIPSDDIDGETRNSPPSPGADDGGPPPNNAPTAVASATPTSGTAPLTVVFTGSNSSDPDVGDSITYSWDLNGDGTYGDSTAANPTTVYSIGGTYTVHLKVTDTHAATTTSSAITITVTSAAGNGASTATCSSPNPCGAATATTYTGLNTDDGAGKTVTRSYKVYRPAGLTNASNNKVPAIVTDCGGVTSKNAGTDDLLTLASANNLIIVCASAPRGAWIRGTTGASNTGGTDVSTCGNSGTAACDDTPFIVAMVADIQNGTSTGSPSPDQHIDPAKVWAIGGSNAGQMFAWELMCSTQSSSLFAGFGQVSALFQNAGTDDHTVAMVCPAIPSNHNFDWIEAHGTVDSQLINTCTTPWTSTHCEPGILGGSPSHWYWGPIAGTTMMRGASKLNCADNTLTTSTHGTGNKWAESDWTCSASNTGAAEYIGTGAGHALGGTQGYNGFNLEQDIYDFFTSHWRG